MGLRWQLIFIAFLCYQLNVDVAAGPMKRIVNGLNAAVKQFPYQVFIDIFYNFNWYADCGGVIISNRIILTAAHCIATKYLAYRIHLGTWNRTNALEKGQQQVVLDPSCAVVHPRWDPDQVINDIALLIVPFEIHFNAYIQPAKLPDPNHCYDNTQGIVSGWGTTNVQVGGVSDILQYYVVGVLSNDECAKLLHELQPGIIIPESYICLKPSASSPCFGDSGGPLARKNSDGSSTLLGVTSFILDSQCTPGKPAVYTRVSSYLSWIKCHVDSLDDCNSTCH